MGEIALVLSNLDWLRKLPFVFIFAANEDHDDSQSIKVENIACGPDKCLNLAEGGQVLTFVCWECNSDDATE